jgi:hypothetical protein
MFKYYQFQNKIILCIGKLALLPVVGEAQPPKAATGKCANVSRYFIFFFIFRA